MQAHYTRSLVYPFMRIDVDIVDMFMICVKQDEYPKVQDVLGSKHETSLSLSTLFLRLFIFRNFFIMDFYLFDEPQ